MDHDLPPELASRRDEIYTRVTKRARTLRARRLGVIATTVAIVVALPIAAVALVVDRDGGRQIKAVAPPSTDVSAATSTTTDTNRPATELVRVDPARPHAGETVAFTVRAVDPSRAIFSCDVTASFSDEYVAQACGVICADTGTERPQSGDVTKTFSHVFRAPGSYTVRFDVKSGHCTRHPFSWTTATTVVVSP